MRTVEKKRYLRRGGNNLGLEEETRRHMFGRLTEASLLGTGEGARILDKGATQGEMTLTDFDRDHK